MSKMNQPASPELSPVESAALARSPFDALYPAADRLPTIVVESFPALGRLAAMRFLEWVQQNPEGVVALPTGRTPEHFIRWTKHLLRTWQQPGTQAMLEQCGIDPSERPPMGGLRFVQIDEFYPMDPAQHNSFHHYVRHYYIDGFGLDPARAMLMDCSRIGLREGQTLESVWPDHRVDLSLRHRQAEGRLEHAQKAALCRIDQWCQDYEDHIRALGGIGFFLGGIGPDGHVGFNVRGADHHSTTRLTHTNYETQAAAAVDLGGIEVARHRLVITIGLGTITFNPNCTAVIIAAGNTKAQVVADAVQRQPHVRYPATALHKLAGARFYVTRGAASALAERRHAELQSAAELCDREVETILVDRAASLGSRLEDLDEEAVRKDRFGALVARKRNETIADLLAATRRRLVERIERGAHTLTDTHFLHTEPHHDDIMLAYLPYVVRHVRHASNTHYFATLTSGFTSVSNAFMLGQLSGLRRFMETEEFADLHAEGYFEPENRTARDRDVWQLLDGIAAEDAGMRAEGAARRLFRDMAEVHGTARPQDVRARLAEASAYLAGAYPGQKDPEPIQRLKGMRREYEAECLWGYFGWRTSNIRHLRLGFYTGDVFTPEPTPERDVAPVLELLRETRPDVVTVALDPEASGPDTHYKALQAMTEALRRYEKETGRPDIRVWGYRNVWYRFHPVEANVHVPVSLNMFAVASSAFLNTFASQRDASFPSYEHDGPFSELAQRIQVQQYRTLKTCLGRDWFHEHPSPLIRATRGLVFLREMDLQELYAHSRALRRHAEHPGDEGP